ncbi:MAG TPA: UDP-N-acetylmuramoyl-L-alanyl-D-glutamate--2,6-diaminopimelate ligase [archaeon]|nr:UDP-N-acetylmuramoyl-L-alanyl-D-glutamate--2,6-diaminopimelate ligase [archaeon]
MRLTTLLGAIGAVSRRGSVGPVEVTGLVVDSRKVIPGDLFFALVGSSADGHEFLEQVWERGAIGAVVSRINERCPIEQFVVQDTREALGLAACEFYDYPSRKFPLIGVTGTNGKTTVAFLVRSILASEGIKCGLLGTVYNILGEDRVSPSELTTAQANDIQRMLSLMQENGCRAAVMEVSSHGLDQKRSYGCQFQVAIFTNLTADHLDYHPDMEHYFRAKSTLFNDLGKQGRAVVGWDDPFGERLVSRIEGPVITFGKRKKSDIRIVSWKPLSEGAWIQLEVFGRPVRAKVSLLGRFNAQNIAAAVGVAAAMGINPSRIAQALFSLRAVPGRMEPVDLGQPFRVIVDYAHTPDALEKALQAAREHTQGRLVSLFGCGGCRYRLKRGAMGEISARLADFTLITSDNPRSEEPSAIIEEIVEGTLRAGSKEGKDFIVEQDRRKAICQAIGLMQPGDTLLIAGKGHEDYQILPTGKIHFDDREVAREALKDLGYGRQNNSLP